MPAGRPTTAPEPATDESTEAQIRRWRSLNRYTDTELLQELNDRKAFRDKNKPQDRETP